MYSVSDQGRVKNIKLNRFMDGQMRGDGNRYVHLVNGDDHRVVGIHILVAENFALGFVNHNRRQRVFRIDGDSENNSFSNLRYKNTRHVQKDIPPHEPLKRRVIETVETGEIFETVIDASHSLGVAVSSIYRVLNGGRSSVNGIRLQYKWVL